MPGDAVSLGIRGDSGKVSHFCCLASRRERLSGGYTARLTLCLVLSRPAGSSR